MSEEYLTKTWCWSSDGERLTEDTGDPVLEVTLNLVIVRSPSHLYTVGIANRASTVLDALEKWSRTS